MNNIQKIKLFLEHYERVAGTDGRKIDQQKAKELLKRLENIKIRIPFTMEDLEDLQHGKTFDWCFDNIEVHLYNEEI